MSIGYTADMTTAQAYTFEYGRAPLPSPQTVSSDNDLTDPQVLSALIVEATKVARAEQRKRVRRTSRSFFSR